MSQILENEDSLSGWTSFFPFVSTLGAVLIQRQEFDLKGSQYKNYFVYRKISIYVTYKKRKEKCTFFFLMSWWFCFRIGIRDVRRVMKLSGANWFDKPDCSLPVMVRVWAGL